MTIVWIELSELYHLLIKNIWWRRHLCYNEHDHSGRTRYVLRSQVVKATRNVTIPRRADDDFDIGLNIILTSVVILEYSLTLSTDTKLVSSWLDIRIIQLSFWVI